MEKPGIFKEGSFLNLEADAIAKIIIAYEKVKF